MGRNDGGRQQHAPGRDRNPAAPASQPETRDRQPEGDGRTELGEHGQEGGVERQRPLQAGPDDAEPDQMPEAPAAKPQQRGQ